MSCVGDPCECTTIRPTYSQYTELAGWWCLTCHFSSPRPFERRYGRDARSLDSRVHTTWDPLGVRDAVILGENALDVRFGQRIELQRDQLPT